MWEVTTQCWLYQPSACGPGKYNKSGWKIHESRPVSRTPPYMAFTSIVASKTMSWVSVLSSSVMDLLVVRRNKPFSLSTLTGSVSLENWQKSIHDYHDEQTLVERYLSTCISNAGTENQRHICIGRRKTLSVYSVIVFVEESNKSKKIKPKKQNKTRTDK